MFQISDRGLCISRWQGRSIVVARGPRFRKVVCIM